MLGTPLTRVKCARTLALQALCALRHGLFDVDHACGRRQWNIRNKRKGRKRKRELDERELCNKCAWKRHGEKRVTAGKKEILREEKILDGENCSSKEYSKEKRNGKNNNARNDNVEEKDSRKDEYWICCARVTFAMTQVLTPTLHYWHFSIPNVRCV